MMFKRANESTKSPGTGIRRVVICGKTAGETPQKLRAELILKEREIERLRRLVDSRKVSSASPTKATRLTVSEERSLAAMRKVEISHTPTRLSEAPERLRSFKFRLKIASLTLDVIAGASKTVLTFR